MVISYRIVSYEIRSYLCFTVDAKLHTLFVRSCGDVQLEIYVCEAIEVHLHCVYLSVILSTPGCRSFSRPSFGLSCISGESLNLGAQEL